MERFFKEPTPKYLARHIYNQMIFVHETGGRSYYYRIPQGLPISTINETIDLLAEVLLDADVLQYENGCIIVDWS